MRRLKRNAGTLDLKPSGFAAFVVERPCTLTLCTRALSIFIYQVKPHCRCSYCFVLSLPTFHQHCFFVCTVPVHSGNKDSHLHSTPISFLFILEFHFSMYICIKLLCFEIHRIMYTKRNWSKIWNETDVPISVVHVFVSLFGNFVYKYCN